MAEDPALPQDARAAASAAAMAMHPRYEDTFPTLTPAEIERLRRFGTLHHYQDGACLFKTGTPVAGMFILLSGHVAITQRDGLGHVTPVVEQGPGQFLGEIATLSDRPALVDACAEGEVEALLIPPEGVRALLVAEAELGQRLMRAMILRRVSLIQSGVGGPVLIGSPYASGTVRLQSFLTRNGYPHHVLDPAVNPEAEALVASYRPSPQELPLVACPNGTMLRNPSEAELARALGMVSFLQRKAQYDVAVVGGGPAGMATAVYAASEGLSVIMFDARAFGGQAGASARIENYLGFPTGISGQALAGRAFVQAQKFGADMLIPVEVKRLDCFPSGGLFALELDGGEPVLARTVVVASGARYRRPNVLRLKEFEGRGVWYWASPIEAKLCTGEDVIVVGGGNSAGQAAVFLSGHARKVRIMVRGPGLAESMSRYLIDRIMATPNIELMTETEIVALEGTPEQGLQRVRWRNRRSGTETEGNIRNVFLFIGADPATEWLGGCGVRLDKAGFVTTGPRCAESRERPLAPLESSVPGVFAVGDVRSGSVKRIGGAIGEGAQVVQSLHAFLGDAMEPQLAEAPAVT
jgi:thioredoxin reductase (NADPH)